MSALGFDPIDTMAMDPTQRQHSLVTQAAQKIMRRIEIAKVSSPASTADRSTADPSLQVVRDLQDCLAFASFKAQNGWQDCTLDTIEPDVAEKLSRRKSAYRKDSNTSSVCSTLLEDARTSLRHGITDYRGSARSYAEHRKRVRATFDTGRHTQSVSCAQEHNVGYVPSMNRPRTVDVPFPPLQNSLMFDTASVPPHIVDLAVSATQEHPSSVVSSSSPETPLPTAHRIHVHSKQAGAELLHYLGEPQTSATYVHHISSTAQGQPSTLHYVSSSRPQTPVDYALLNSAPHTPSNFDLAEFCNITPPPVPAHSSRVCLVGQSFAHTARCTLDLESSTYASPAAQWQLPGELRKR